MKHIGKIFGDYRISEKLPQYYKNNTSAYKGVCLECGNEKISTIYRFRDNKYEHSFKSCVDCFVEYEYVGQEFGDMVILEHRFEQSTRYLDVICSVCGREKVVQYNDFINLKLGVKHGQGCARQLGRDDIRFYDIWSSMKSRCNNPNNHNYDNYGGRGIKCSYDYYVDFYDDMHESYIEHCLLNGVSETTIERIDVNGDYIKSNMTWATKAEQNRNRTTNLKFKGISPDGNVYYDKSMRRFAINHKLNDSSIRLCLKGKQKTHKGWTFKYI